MRYDGTVILSGLQPSDLIRGKESAVVSQKQILRFTQDDTARIKVSSPSFWIFFCVTLFFLALPALAADQEIISARVWPAQDYTRITFESKSTIQSTFFTVEDPDRLVLDLQGIHLGPALQELASKVKPDDPFVKLIRVGRFKADVVRVVIELKTEVKPQIFILKPIAEYGHRLVLDLYPVVPSDPLLALLLLEKPDYLADDVDRQIEKPTTQKRKTSPESQAKDTKAKGKPAVTHMITRMITVVIDAGHGGEDPGARGRKGTYEKNITLAIAKKLKARIDEETNMRAVLTRDGDYFIPLHIRVAKARRVRADLFVSIHADAYMKHQVRGSSVFALSERGATSAAAKLLAKQENEADLIGGVNLDLKDRYLAKTLLDLSQTATINDSLRLGKSVLGEIGGINTLHKGFVEQAGFAVLKAPDIPSILVETAFITNPEEEKRLNNNAYQEKLAAAILKGIKQYFIKYPPLPKSKVAQAESSASF